MRPISAFEYANQIDVRPDRIKCKCELNGLVKSTGRQTVTRYKNDNFYSDCYSDVCEKYQTSSTLEFNGPTSSVALRSIELYNTYSVV